MIEPLNDLDTITFDKKICIKYILTVYVLSTVMALTSFALQLCSSQTHQHLVLKKFDFLNLTYIHVTWGTKTYQWMHLIIPFCHLGGKCTLTYSVAIVHYIHLLQVEILS